MEAALLLGPERVAIDDVTETRPASGEVMIQPAIAGICGTDLSFFAGRRLVHYPFILGHELSGRVIALGE